MVGMGKRQMGMGRAGNSGKKEETDGSCCAGGNERVHVLMLGHDRPNDYVTFVSALVAMGMFTSIAPWEMEPLNVKLGRKGKWLGCRWSHLKPH